MKGLLCSHFPKSLRQQQQHAELAMRKSVSDQTCVFICELSGTEKTKVSLGPGSCGVLSHARSGDELGKSGCVVVRKNTPPVVSHLVVKVRRLSNLEN